MKQPERTPEHVIGIATLPCRATPVERLHPSRPDGSAPAARDAMPCRRRVGVTAARCSRFVYTEVGKQSAICVAEATCGEALAEHSLIRSQGVNPAGGGERDSD